MNWLESTGTLIYDPHGRASDSRDKVSEPWWLLLMCDQGIVDYANYWLRKRGIYLHKYSLYGSHVSVVKGEEPPNKELWKKYHGKKIKFQYSNEYNTNQNYWWTFINCPELSEIRKELGLSPDPPYFRFHLTVGRLEP